MLGLCTTEDEETSVILVGMDWATSGSTSCICNSGMIQFSRPHVTMRSSPSRVKSLDSISLVSCSKISGLEFGAPLIWILPQNKQKHCFSMVMRSNFVD